MRWTGRNPRHRVTVGHRPGLKPLSSVPWDQALTVPHGASYTTHSTPLPRSLELHHGEMLPSSFWIKGPRVGVLHWSGRGWSSEIWGLERCKGCVKVCSRYWKPSWLSLALMCVCVCVMCPQAMAAVTRALQESSMGLNPEVEGTIIRVPVPRWVFYRPGPESP